MDTTYTFRLSEGLKRSAKITAMESNTDLSKVMIMFLEKFVEGEIDFIPPSIAVSNAIADAEVDNHLRSK